MVVRCAACLQQRFCLQKTFCASERLVLLTLHRLQRPSEVFRVLWWYCQRVDHKKRRLTAARCSVLPFPRQGSQTRPDVSRTYCTLRHCKVLSLPVGMEEGPRSKAVCASGLEYCQYSYEIINLVTLPSDLARLRLPSQWRTGGGLGCSNPPPLNSEGPPKSCQTQPDL